jgi:hypothetical protein
MSSNPSSSTPPQFAVRLQCEATLSPTGLLPLSALEPFLVNVADVATVSDLRRLVSERLARALLEMNGESQQRQSPIIPSIIVHNGSILEDTETLKDIYPLSTFVVILKRTIVTQDTILSNNEASSTHSIETNLSNLSLSSSASGLYSFASSSFSQMSTAMNSAISSISSLPPSSTLKKEPLKADKIEPKKFEDGTKKEEKKEKVLVQDEEENTCTICFDPYIPQYPEVKLRCGHGYHDHCLREWSNHCKFCPLCRAEMVLVTPGVTTDRDRLLRDTTGGIYSTSAVSTIQPSRFPQVIPQGNAQDTPAQKVHIGNFLSNISQVFPPSSSTRMGLLAASLVVTNIPTVDEINNAMEKTRQAISNSSSYASFTRALNDLPGHAQSGNLSHGISNVATAAGRGVATAGWELTGRAATFGVTAIPMALGVAAVVGATPAVLLGLTVATAASVAISAVHKTNSEYESQQKRYDEAFQQHQQNLLQQQQMGEQQTQVQQQTQQQQVRDLVQCPQCHAMLKPPEGAPIFACPCGVHLQRP